MNITELAQQALARIRAEQPDVTKYEKYELAGLRQDGDIQRQFREHGYVLLWSDVLADYLAYYSTIYDLDNVPSWFVPYSNIEMEKLFGDPNTEWSVDDLRRIHMAKKIARFEVTDVVDE
jgi:hypothetical protein